MLASLRRGSGPPRFTENEPFALLVGCHARIRAFTALAVALPRVPADDRDVARAAEDVLRYFTLALPLHEEDEEDELVEALRLHAPHDSWGPILATVREEHRAIDAALAGLTPLWEEVARNPAALARHKSELDRGATSLEALFEPHLALEEDRLFPLARRYLPAEAQGGLLEAFRERRRLSFAS